MSVTTEKVGHRESRPQRHPGGPMGRLEGYCKELGGPQSQLGEPQMKLGGPQSQKESESVAWGTEKK